MSSNFQYDEHDASNLVIYTNGDISLSGKLTGLTVTQTKDATIVIRREGSLLGAKSLGVSPRKYMEFPMPAQRYSLAHPNPASGNPGSAAFARDFIDLFSRYNFSRDEINRA
jgi:hypothetical protein